MFSNALITPLILVLIASSVFTMVITLRQQKEIARLKQKINQKPLLEIGNTLPNLEGITFKGKATFQNEQIRDFAKVFMFVSTYCDKCKGKLREIEHLMGHCEPMGVAMKIVTDEPDKRIQAFIRSERILNNTVSVTQDTMTDFNPLGAFPYYLFLDQENVLQAQGYIGDDNWLAFVNQINEGVSYD